MREIKFRAWDEKKKIMISSVGFTDSDCGREWIREQYMVDGGSNGSSMNDWIPMQYTGLKDKHGKKIYEGDIVSTSDNGIPDEDKWSNDDWGYEEVIISTENGVSFGDWPWQDEQSVFALKYIEVVGNIYENPELIGMSK